LERLGKRIIEAVAQGHDRAPVRSRRETTDASSEVGLGLLGRWPWAVVGEMQPSEWRRLAGLARNASKALVFSRAVPPPERSP
jgi:hypothetical protein